MNKNLKAKLTSPAPISYDEPAPAPAATIVTAAEARSAAADFAVGDRVSAVVWGVEKQGTVEKVGSAVSFVRWDGAKALTWMHNISLTKIAATPLDAQTIAIAALKLIAARPLHHCGNEDDRRVVKIAINALKDIDVLNS